MESGTATFAFGEISFCSSGATTVEEYRKYVEKDKARRPDPMPSMASTNITLWLFNVAMENHHF